MAEVATSEKTGKRYLKIEFLGEGQFATVYKAKDTKTGRIVAIKKIKLGDRYEAADGVNRSALREIKLLQELEHENLIDLLDVFGHKSNINLVFHFMHFDLERVVRDSRILLTAAHIKQYLLQILRGLEYLHANWVLHRDLKPNNMLLNDAGLLRISDFGLAKAFGNPDVVMTHQVVTRWYRSPELLFGARAYSTGVDMWSVGCILAELLLRAPFLAGETDLGQLSKIFDVLGTPTDAEWPDRQALPDFVEFRPSPPMRLETIFSAASTDTIQLLNWMMRLNPSRRCTATEALQSDYFRNQPRPAARASLPVPRPEDESAQFAANIEPAEPTTSGKKRKADAEDGPGVKPNLQNVKKRLVFE